MACKPKISSKSHRRFKFSMVVMFFIASSCIYAIKSWYYSITCFTKDNMLIHLIFMFLSNLFPFFINTSHKLWNSRNFLGEWKKNPYKACKKASNRITKLNFDNQHNQVGSMNKTIYSHKKWNHILFHLCSDTSSSTLKHITTITAHWNELGSQLLNTQTPKCDHGSEHRIKNVFNCPLHTHLLQTSQNWNLFPTLNNIKMQRNPKCIIYCNKLIIIDKYKISKTNNILNGFQQQLIHEFSYAPTLQNPSNVF